MSQCCTAVWRQMYIFCNYSQLCEPICGKCIRVKRDGMKEHEMMYRSWFNYPPPTRSKWIPQKHHVKSPSSFHMVHSHWWLCTEIPFTARKYSTFEERMNPELLWTTRFFTEYFITHVLIKSKKASHPHHSPWSWISWELLYVMWASEQRDTILANII